MNNKEAIKRLKEVIEDCTSGEDEPYREAFGMGILALEKQIPKKVDYSELNYSNLPVAKCPSCRNTTINDNRLLSSAKYCPDCGEKLDWDI